MDLLGPFFMPPHLPGSLIVPREGKNDLFLLSDYNVVIVDEPTVAALDFDPDAGFDDKGVSIVHNLIFRHWLFQQFWILVSITNNPYRAGLLF